MCGVSASLFGRSGGSGAVIVRYSYTSSGDSPVLGGVTVRSADGGHRAVLTGFVIAFGSAESATVTLKLWPTADATSVQTRSVVVPSTQTDAFVQAVGGLVPGTSYSYEVYVDSSNKVEGTVVLENGNPGISTTAASAQSVSGSSFEKYLVLPTGTNDFTVAGGYVDMLVVGGGGAGGFGGNGVKDGGSAGGGGGGVLHVGRKYFSHGTYRAVVGAGGRKMTSKSSSEGWGQLSSVSLVSATGTIAYYGAGGGGGTGGSATAQLPGLGGSGLGGLGYDYTHNTVEAGSGAAGTGSGGGGGGSSKTSGGAGGDGTVILRYFDGSSLAGRGLPLVAWTPEQYVPTVSSLSFNVSVPFVGIGCDGVSLSARYWTDAEDCGDVSKATTVVLNANFMDPETREFTLTGLSPARTYFVQVLATNASGSDISSTYEMRTLQSLGEKMTRTQYQAYNTFTYSVGSLATGVSTLKLMASQDGGETWQQLGESWTATVGDSLQVSHNLLDVEGFAFGVSTKCK